MKVIIAGSRNIVDYKHVEDAMFKSNAYKHVTEVVSGGARGVDTLAIDWAKKHKVKYTVKKADWNNLKAPGAEIVIDEKDNSPGPAYRYYNARAGLQRNEEMGNYADALVAIWDGVSTGTLHMINYMKKLGKKVFVYRVTVPPPKRKGKVGYEQHD